MQWEVEVVVVDGLRYRDHVSEDGRWRIVGGYDERERLLGKPWMLLSIGERRREKRVDCFATIEEAKRCAEDL